MISQLVSIVLNAVIGFLNIILIPIDIFISNILPADVLDIFTTINDFIDFIISNIPYVINMTLLPAFIVKVIVDYIIFAISVRYVFYVVKLAIKWYDKLKP